MRHVQGSTRDHFPRPKRPGRRVAAPTRDELHALFVEQAIPAAEIARRWGVSQKVIYSRVQEYGLRPTWDAEELRRLYVDENLSCEEIAPRFGKSASRIYQLLDEHGIERRRRNKNTRERLPDEATLRRLYVGELLAANEIARRYHLSASAINQALTRLGLRAEREAVAPRPVALDEAEIVRQYRDEGLTVPQIAATIGHTGKVVTRILDLHGVERRDDRRFGGAYPTAAELYRLHWDEGLDLAVIAGRYGVGATTIAAWMVKHGVAARGIRFPKRGSFVASDGHRLHSTLELAVDEWLYAHGILHRHDVRIPGSTFRTDFVVGDTFIEVWGVLKRAQYDARKQIKLALYAELGLPLISVVPSDFPHLTPLEVLLA